MKVVLLKEVKGVGRAGEVKNVADGYAQNYLIPNKLAEIASDRNVEKVETGLKKKKQEKAKTKVKTNTKKKKKKS